MDFTNRNAQPQSFQPGSQPDGMAASQPTNNKPKDKKLANDVPRWYGWANSAMLVVGILLLVSVVALLYASKPENQSKYVENNKLQAVFLNTGQVYFGNIRNINNQYFVLGNIYYLQTAATGTSSAKTTDANNISLIKLGCELHQPYDQMVINRDQITFWENLQDNGQVAKAVASFVKQNPNGQKCSNQGAGVNSTNVQGNTGANTGTGATTTKP
jgi:hypothetical protein